MKETRKWLPTSSFILFVRFPILRKQSAGAAGMDEQNIVIGFVETLSCAAYQPGKGFTGLCTDLN